MNVSMVAKTVIIATILPLIREGAAYTLPLTCTKSHILQDIESGRFAAVRVDHIVFI
jgi:hypothetical protein